MSGAQYRAVPAAQLRIVALDDLTLVYHRASGITHLLAAPAPEIIAALGDTAMTAAALYAAFAERFEMIDGNAAALAARIDELVEVGLVLRE